MVSDFSKLSRVVTSYARGMPLSTALRYIFDTVRIAVTLPLLSLPKHTLHFYPDWPLPAYFLWSVASAARVRIKPGIGMHTMLFKDTELIDERELPHEHVRWINGRCLDIRKSTIARAFEKVSGRILVVNPETYTGAAVRKSEQNGSHDGFVVECPTQNEKGYVYQKLIDNSISDKCTEDIRVVVVGTELPAAIVKTVPLAQRFSALPSKARVESPETLFTNKEHTLIFAFCRELNLDFGEIDVLRDRRDGELYIVDVNPTALAHPVVLSFAERLKLIRRSARAFRRQFLQSSVVLEPRVNKAGSVQ